MIKTRHAIALLIVVVAAAGHAQERGRRGSGEGRDQARMPTLAFRTEVPAHDYDLILGRPTKDAVTLSVLAYREISAGLAYGLEPEKLDRELPVREFKPGQPADWVIEGLQPGTRYFYQFRPAKAAGGIPAGAASSFTTAAPAARPFAFAVQADSHLDFGTDPDVYVKSLNQAVAARPDFFVDLGDTFMTDKRSAYREALPQYLAQRYYLGIIGRSAPVFLVLGNHDGESVQRGSAGDAMALWSNATRKKYFPNPEPNGFYTGNPQPVRCGGPAAGLLCVRVGRRAFRGVGSLLVQRASRARGRQLGAQPGSTPVRVVAAHAAGQPGEIPIRVHP
jgi:hypothetical protein